MSDDRRARSGGAKHRMGEVSEGADRERRVPQQRGPGAATPRATPPPRSTEQESRPNTKPWWLRHGVTPYLVLVDTMAYGVAAQLTEPTLPWHLVVLVVTLLTFSLVGLNRSRLTFSILDDLPYICAAVLIGHAMKVSLVGLVPPEPLIDQAAHASTLLLCVAAFRAAAYWVVRRARSRGDVRHPTMILGTGPLGRRLACTLLERREFGLDPVGFIDAEVPTVASPLLPAPVLGRYEHLARHVTENSIRVVIVAFGSVDEMELVDVLRTCDRLDVDVFVVPRLFELHNVTRDTDEAWGIPLIRLRRAPFRSPWWTLKRPMDVMVASLALVLLSPVIALCALAVRIEGGPGVLFRQERVGLDGKRFALLKLRSLRPVDQAESETTWNIQHDDRLGPVGRFLRATSLDELPQLWNILRGDMSFVGPRPERPHFVDLFDAHVPRYMARHRVPAGLTGWAQSHGLRGDTSIEDRAMFDNYYIENWSPWLDIKIALKTVGQVLLKRGG